MGRVGGCNGGQAIHHILGFPDGTVVTDLPASAGSPRDTVQSLGQEDPLEKEMATHSSILAWRIPWTEEPGRLQFMGSKESDTAKHTQTSTNFITYYQSSVGSVLWAVDILVKTVFSSSRACSNKQSQHNIIKLLMMIRCRELRVGRGGIFNPVWRAGEFSRGDCT